ncbi:MAG: Na(+)-translocating NADH-quinone reductase subunit B [Myxococcales bacterium SG8_38_1]|jgi:Na+-transporting NADH:ubiquinone oxidoreductase subunit B|nr:MAG: Na(+)-translocating NADH-quinone reductase subunit B [Myxococcales bacterium SG8_38_1]
MSPLRKLLDQLEPQFRKGARLERYQAVFEMLDTLLYSPSDVSRRAPHVRDAINLKRVMGLVVIGVLPCALVGMWNAGYHANLAIADLGLDAPSDWRGALMAALGIGHDPGSVGASTFYGLLYFLPIYLVTLMAGGFWEVLFAGVRNHEVNEGFFVTSILYALTLPATTPLWQVALGISFGVVIGKEVFGGTGKNFMNPALAGRAFLYFAYPIEMSGESVWVPPVDVITGATPLAIGAENGVAGIVQSGVTWMDAFLGLIQGSLGETSALACLLGGIFIIYTGVASWRIIAGVLLGAIATALLFNAVGSDTNPMFAMSWQWHIVLGGFAFGTVFMATDPVTACVTNPGRWVFGSLVGVLTVVIRVVNLAFPEGIMLAILFANIFAPTIDYFVVRANISRRVKRSA